MATFTQHLLNNGVIPMFDFIQQLNNRLKSNFQRNIAPWFEDFFTLIQYATNHYLLPKMLDMVLQIPILLLRLVVNTRIFCAKALDRTTLLDRNIGPNGGTLLHAAALFDDVTSLRALIKAGANIHATDMNFKTPLDIAQERHHSAAALVLGTEETVDSIRNVAQTFSDTASTVAISMSQISSQYLPSLARFLSQPQSNVTPLNSDLEPEPALTLPCRNA
jgi:hypothetical protein